MISGMRQTPRQLPYDELSMRRKVNPPCPPLTGEYSFIEYILTPPTHICFLAVGRAVADRLAPRAELQPLARAAARAVAQYGLPGGALRGRMGRPKRRRRGSSRRGRLGWALDLHVPLVKATRGARRGRGGGTEAVDDRLCLLDCRNGFSPGGGKRAAAPLPLTPLRDGTGRARGKPRR